MVVEKRYGKPIQFMRSEEIQLELDGFEITHGKLDHDGCEEEFYQCEEQIPFG